MNNHTAPVQVSDADLVASVRQGDRRAYNDLVSRYREGVVRVVYRMYGDMDLAEEAAQEAFIRAWQHIHNYRPQYSFQSWIYRIAINAAIDSLRRQRNEVSLEGLVVADPHEGPEGKQEKHDQIEAVRKAVLSLPSAARSVLILREYEELSYSEIAHTLDIPLGTVMSRLSYARNQLRQNLVRYLENV